MSARNPPHPGWVTVAAAAQALTEAGDPIDASNVSRYLARNDDVPSEKHGKFRWVNFAALRAHRSTSVYVADKRDARDLEPVRTPFASPRQLDVEDEGAAPPNSALAQTKLEIQQLDLRRKRREEDIEEGRLVPIDELQAVVSAMMGAFVAELARQEQILTARLGREAGMEIRKAHRAARAAASARLIEAAQAQLHPAASARLDASVEAETEAA
jgi:hypothetical protein